MDGQLKEAKPHGVKKLKNSPARDTKSNKLQELPN